MNHTNRTFVILPNDDGTPRGFDASLIRGESSSKNLVRGHVLSEPARDGTVRVELQDPYGWTVLPMSILKFTGTRDAPAHPDSPTREIVGEDAHAKARAAVVAEEAAQAAIETATLAIKAAEEAKARAAEAAKIAEEKAAAEAEAQAKANAEVAAIVGSDVVISFIE